MRPWIILYIGICLILPSPAHAQEATPGSNVLFLPGIKGSRLYGSDGNKLWEPFGNHDVENLMLDHAGKSVQPGIHPMPDDIIDSVAGITDIYGSFVRFMDGLVDEGTINEWAPLSYDWRLSLPDIVSAGTQGPGPVPLSLESYGPPPLLEVLENLSQSSATGKVTIVAHSNGGLVAKELLRTLGNDEAARLVDALILIGVPQSGAPQALGALLYGYREGLPSWFPGIVSTATARAFAENAPMGYHLLPSSSYFDDRRDDAMPVVRFDALHSYQEERDAYGATIENVDELTAFALAHEGSRTKPTSANVFEANVLNAALLSYARETHDAIDAWAPPPGMHVYQLAGMNADTMTGIEYYERCVLALCRELYRPTFASIGDGVVPIKSALEMEESESVRSETIDLAAYGSFGFGKKDHGTLLSIDDVQTYVREVLAGVRASLFVRTALASTEDEQARRDLRIYLHRSARMLLTDTQGNRTGVDSDGFEHEEIPGTTYGIFGDVAYITAPTGEAYRLEVRREDPHTFDLELIEMVGGATHASASFPEVALADAGSGVMNIGEALLDSSALDLDRDGDDRIDASLPFALDGMPTHETEKPLGEERQTKTSGNTATGASEHERVAQLQRRLYVLLLTLLYELLAGSAYPLDMSDI